MELNDFALLKGREIYCEVYFREKPAELKQTSKRLVKRSCIYHIATGKRKYNFALLISDKPANKTFLVESMASSKINLLSPLLNGLSVRPITH